VLPSTSAEERSTDNARAYELYLKGRYVWNKRTEASIRKSIDYFQQAATTAPAYALPYAGLADAYAALTSYSDIAPNDAFPQAKEAAANALRLDEALPEAHTALGFVREAFDWQWAEAEREYQRALALDPSYAVGHHRYGMFLCAIGRREEGIAQVEQAHRLDSTSMIINADQGLAYYLGRHYEQATEQLRNAVDMEPAFARSHVYLAYAYVQQRNFDAAIAEASKATELSGGRAGAILAYAYAAAGRKSESHSVIASIVDQRAARFTQVLAIASAYVALGEADEAFEWLEKGYRDRAYLARLSADPAFDPIRDDPRFRDLLKRLNLPAR